MPVKLVSRRAVSPLISTLLIMVMTMLALSVTLGYTQATLTRKNGETDFESAKNFMRNLALQVDDVAWVKGRVDTVHFTSQYGQIEYLSDAVQYRIDFYDGSNRLVGSNVTDCDVFMYNMPTEKYYLEEGYYEPLIIEGSNNIIAIGTNAPVTRVFAAQSSTVGDAQFLRIVLVPALRCQTYNVTSNDITTRYVRIYLPKLQPGYSSSLPKSVVLTGLDIKTEIHEAVRRIDVSLVFPMDAKYYDNNFFQFKVGDAPAVTQSISLTGDSNAELYIGMVRLDYGA